MTRPYSSRRARSTSSSWSVAATMSAASPDSAARIGRAIGGAAGWPDEIYALPWRWEPVGLDGWSPRRPGERLEGDALAAQLNIVEGWLLDADGDDFDRRWRLALARREMLRYRLDLGRLGEACFHCGAAEGLEQHCCGSRAWPFHWTQPICAACDALRPHVWPTLPGDDQLTEAIRIWRDRRPTVPPEWD